MAEETSNEGSKRTGQLGIQKIYVKDLSYEAPGTPQVFREEWKPGVDIQLANKATPLGNDLYEVVLAVTVTVRSGEKTAFLVEVHQAGIFNIGGFPEQHLAAVLATVCPNILFPYVREAVSDVVAKAGFPQLLLAPVNFDALYAQELQRQRAAQPQAEGKAH
ncbi:MAG: protein-export chaperone SecB [Chromatiales bacterium]